MNITKNTIITEVFFSGDLQEYITDVIYPLEKQGHVKFLNIQKAVTNIIKVEIITDQGLKLLRNNTKTKQLLFENLEPPQETLYLRDVDIATALHPLAHEYFNKEEIGKNLVYSTITPDSYINQSFLNITDPHNTIQDQVGYLPQGLFKNRWIPDTYGLPWYEVYGGLSGFASRSFGEPHVPNTESFNLNVSMVTDPKQLRTNWAIPRCSVPNTVSSESSQNISLNTFNFPVQQPNNSREIVLDPNNTVTVETTTRGTVAVQRVGAQLPFSSIEYKTTFNTSSFGISQNNDRPDFKKLPGNYDISHSDSGFVGDEVHTSSVVVPVLEPYPDLVFEVIDPFEEGEGQTGIEPIFGCTNSQAANYNPDANIEDGTCIFELALESSNQTQIISLGRSGLNWITTFIDMSQDGANISLISLLSNNVHYSDTGELADNYAIIIKIPSGFFIQVQKINGVISTSNPFGSSLFGYDYMSYTEIYQTVIGGNQPRGLQLQVTGPVIQSHTHGILRNSHAPTNIPNLVWPYLESVNITSDTHPLTPVLGNIQLIKEVSGQFWSPDFGNLTTLSPGRGYVVYATDDLEINFYNPVVADDDEASIVITDVTQSINFSSPGNKYTGFGDIKNIGIFNSYVNLDENSIGDTVPNLSIEGIFSKRLFWPDSITNIGDIYLGDNASISTQRINMAQGWNIISSYIDTDLQSDQAADFLNILENNLYRADNDTKIESAADAILMAKDETGHVVSPGNGFNGIGRWKTNTGYQIKAFIDCYILLSGTISATQTRTTNNTWFILGVGSSSPINLSQPNPITALIEQGSIQIIKDNNGNAFNLGFPAGLAQGYPDGGKFNDISELVPGQGYLCKRYASTVTFTFTNQVTNLDLQASAGDNLLPYLIDSVIDISNSTKEQINTFANTPDTPISLETPFFIGSDLQYDFTKSYAVKFRSEAIQELGYTLELSGSAPVPGFEFEWNLTAGHNNIGVPVNFAINPFSIFSNYWDKIVSVTDLSNTLKHIDGAYQVGQSVGFNTNNSSFGYLLPGRVYTVISTENITIPIIQNSVDTSFI